MRVEWYLAKLERMQAENEKWLAFAALPDARRMERLGIREEILLLASRMNKLKGA